MKKFLLLSLLLAATSAHARPFVLDQSGNYLPVFGASAGGGGDVSGPSSSIDSSIAVFDSTTGKLLKDTVLTISGQTISGPNTTGGTGNDFPLTLQPGDSAGSSANGNDLNLFGGDSSNGNNPGSVHIQSYSSGGSFWGDVYIDASVLHLFASSAGGGADFNGGGATNIGQLTLSGAGVNASTVAVFNSNKDVVSSAVTSTQLGYISTLSSNVQTQLNAKGDASGPASSTDTALARFSGTGGKTLQNSAVLLSSSALTVPSSITGTSPDNAGSERWGAGATCAFADGTAFGNTARCLNTKNSVFGKNADCNGDSCTVSGYDAHGWINSTHMGRGATGAAGISNTASFGYGSAGTNSAASAFGASSQATGQHTTALGSNTASPFTADISLGYGATCTAANQLCIGTETREIAEAYIGASVTSSAPLSTLTIQPTGGSGSNVAATSLVLGGGKSTGSATPATILFKTTTVGSSGSTPQTLSTRMTIDGTGTVTVAKNLVVSGGVSNTEFDAGTSGSTKTLDFANGSLQKLSITAGVTFTLSNPVAGTVYALKLVQDVTGGHTYTWPITVKWSGGTAPTGSGSNKTDIVTLLWDGTSYYGTAALNY